VAGHETSDHALAFAFAALAVYPEIQQKALEEVRTVVPEGQLPVGRITIYLLLFLSNS
jgi:cytochrome P450